MNIELSRPDITDAERDAVMAVLNTPRLSLGPQIPLFEASMARFIGVKHAVAVSSGTAALHLLVRAFGIGPEDEVITTPFSFIASSNCAVFERAKPVLVDIDPETWNIDPRRIQSAVTPRTKAVIPVDVFGTVPDMDTVNAIAAKHGLHVIEDSCEALGSRYNGRMAGSLGHAGAFGFYPNKQITTGEGGMIVTDDDEIDRICRSMRNQGRDSGMGWLSHERLGFNYRLSDINAALGVVQLQRIHEILERRHRVAEWYRQRLADEERISLQRIPENCEMSWFVFVVKLADDYTEQDRADRIEKLRARGIGCNNYFAPIHLQAPYRDGFGYEQGNFPVCERVAARTIALPFHGGLTESEVDRVCETLRSML